MVGSDEAHFCEEEEMKVCKEEGKSCTRESAHDLEAVENLKVLASLLGFEIIAVRDKRTGRRVDIELGRK